MAELYNRKWSCQEWARHVGHLEQIAGIRLVESLDGKGRGSRAFDVWTGSGLSFRVLAERALDISACHYKGVSLAWLSPVGEAHPAYYEPQGLGWLRSFGGGLLVTCGLDHFGPPCEDAGELLGLHGRVSNLPACCLSHRAWWAGDEYRLEVAGEVRQARVFGENLLLRRRISTGLGANYIWIEDEVVNEGFTPHPHMMMYHFNLGFPLLDEETRLHLETERTFARDAEAEAGLAEWSRFQPPTPGYREQVFLHTPVADSNGQVHVEVENPRLELCLRLSYDKTALPYLVQWKMMGEGLYVLGVEPVNCPAMQGRAGARQSGVLPVLEPGESRRYALKLEVLA
jgi:hypothetical protein